MPVNKICVQTVYGEANLTEASVEINIPGLTKKYTFVHITDLHITSSEEGDSPEMVELALARSKFWQNQAGFVCRDSNGHEHKLIPLEVCELIAERIRKISPDFVFFTGDTVDYPSVSNFRRASQYLSSLGSRYIMAPGNHDTVGDDAGDELKLELQKLTGTLPYSVTGIEGMDIVSFSNGLVKVTKDQVSYLESRIASGRPMLILLHAPVYTEDISDQIRSFWGQGWMLGEEEQSEENCRFRQLLCDHTDVVRAVLAGHVHFAAGDDNAHTSGLAQYIAAPAFTGFYRVINVHG